MKKITLLMLFIFSFGYSQTNNLAATGTHPDVHLNGTGTMQNLSLAPCSYFQPLIATPNGYSISFTEAGRSVADDFTVAANVTFKPDTFTFVVALTDPVVLNSVNIVFYSDNGGLPGTALTGLPPIVPVSQNIVGTAFGRNLREVVLDLSTSGVSLNGGAAGTKFWVALENAIPSNGSDNPFWIAEDVVQGSEAAYKAGTTSFVWQPGSVSFGTPRDMVFKLSGDCSAVPLTYCTASGNSRTFEHITNVTYAGINNTTTAPHPGYNDFTGQVASVYQGETDQISVTILADGGDHIQVFIDWNQNGILNDAGEVYLLTPGGTGSAGPHTFNITVPVGATLGNTRMRVKLGWNQSTPNPCGTFSFGEIEDYTVNVQPAPVGNPPVIVCPADITVNSDAGICTAVVNFSNAIAIDLEDGVIPTTQTGGPASGSAFPVGTTTIEFSATDSDGNTVTCEFDITVIDNQDPVAVCKDITVDLDALGAYTLTAAEINNGSSDNCGIATYELATTGSSSGSLTTTFVGGNALAGSMFDLEAINNLTIDSFDVNMPTGETGNIEVYFKTGTWVGSESNPAAWTLVGTPMNITSAGVGLPTPLNLNLGINVAAGARVAFYITRTTGSLTYTNGTTVGALFASDTNLQMFEGAGKGYPFGSTFQPRNFNGNIVYSTDGVMTPFSGALDCSHVGTNDIYLLITDNSGNVSSCLAKVTVQDVTAPEVVCVGGLDVYLDANGHASISPNDLVVSVVEACNYTISAAGTGGGVSGSLTTLFVSGNGGSTGGAVYFDITVGPADIEINEIDINTDDSGTFTMDVYTIPGTSVGNETNQAAWTLSSTAAGTSAGNDNPSNAVLASPITLTANTTYGMALVLDATHGHRYTNGDGSNENYSNADMSMALGAASNVPFTAGIFSPRIFNGTIHYIGGAASGLDFTCADLGENLIEVTVTDSSGNTATCMAVVNVHDITAPIIICAGTPGPNSEVEDFEGNTIPSGWTSVIQTGSRDWTFGSGTMPTGGSFPSKAAIFNDDAAGSGEVNKATLISPVYNITGSTTTSISFDYAFQEYLGDGKLTVEAFDGTAWQQVFYVDTNTNPTNTGSLDMAAFVNANFQVRFIYDDEGGWSWGAGIDNFTLNYDVAVATPVDIELGPNGTTTIDPYTLIRSIDEACGISSVAIDVPIVTCADIGAPINVTIFVSDTSGNIASCTTQINVVDRLAPVITCPANQTQDPGVGNLYYIVPDYFATGEATAIDNCTSPVTITSQSPAAGTPLSDGTYTITLTAEDEYGNVSTCTFVLKVESVLGIAENDLEKGVTLYPNPATSIVNLVNKTNLSLDKMVIFDINGKMISQIDLRSMQSEKSVDVSSFASGVYMVQIIGDNASTVKRLIIK